MGLFYLFYGTFRDMQSHTVTIAFLGGRETNTRLILEIMQILDAFGNKVGGEKNGDGVPQLETKAMWARDERCSVRTTGACRDSQELTALL